MATGLAVTAAVAFTAVPAAAQAMSVSATGQCASPTVGSVRLDVTADIENPAYFGPRPEARRITGTATVPWTGLAGLGATAVEGTATVKLAVSGTVTSTSTVTLRFPKTPVTPGQDVVVNVSGYTGTTYSPNNATGYSYVDVTGVDLALRPWRADGTPVRPVSGISTSCPLPTPARWMAIRTDSIIGEPFPAPNGTRVTAVTTDSVTMVWNATYGLMGPPSGYEILVDDDSAFRVLNGNNTLTGSVTGLRPDTDYWFRVKGVSLGGERRSDPILVHTAPTHSAYYYDVAGSARVKGAAVALTGQQITDIELATATHTSNLTFAPTDIRLGNSGTARAEFTPVGPATGSLNGGVFTVKSRQKVVLPRVTLRGRTYTTPECSTELVLTLTSGPNYNPVWGGKLTAAFAIPPFSGCGPVTDQVNAAVAGSGNTAQVQLAPWT